MFPEIKHPHHQIMADHRRPHVSARIFLFPRCYCSQNLPSVPLIFRMKRVGTKHPLILVFFPAPAKHKNSNTWSCQLSRTKVNGDVPHIQTLLVNICDFYISILFASCHILRFL